MNNEELKRSIFTSIQSFAGLPFDQAADGLLKAMGYASSRRLPLSQKTADEFLDLYGGHSDFNREKAMFARWRGVDLLFQLTDADLLEKFHNQPPLAAESGIDQNITSYLFFALWLDDQPYSRSQLSGITRDINRLFSVPAMVVFHYGSRISIAIIHRRPHRRQPEKDVLEKVTLIKDVDIHRPHRAHIEILCDLSLPRLAEAGRVAGMEALHAAWQRVLDIKQLNKAFYRELSNWYFWACRECVFPPEAGPDETRNPTSVIRLITRLIFIWFIKEKRLVPETLFDESAMRAALKSLAPDETTYYKAILQNLFFATLNQEDPAKRRFIRETDYQGKNKQYGVFSLYRFREYFNDPEAALNLFRDIPFLNGGLFECLDREREEGEAVPAGCEKEIRRVDGFSGRRGNPLSVPNKLFFPPSAAWT